MILKRKTLPVPQEEAALALDLVRGGKVDRKLIRQVLSHADTKKLKKLGLIGVGLAGAAGLVSAVSQYTFYRAVVARELKKQLAPIRKQLDELEVELRARKEQSAEDESKHAPRR